ncbi:MAG: DUF6492 family protein [Rhodoferax sp.]|nr:DUF6492 family protein [Rhodoferax sp.]
MKPLVLFCKSYSTDLLRVKRLAQSVCSYNSQNLPFYVSVPETELSLFHEHLDELNVRLVSDEDILRASPGIDAQKVAQMPGSMAQQVVKSEFWRLAISEAYLCLDSDAVFIRPFDITDFMTPDGIPYTVIDEAHGLLEEAIRQKRERVVTAFNREADLVQNIFGRVGRRYSFGPFPLVWHRAVWQSLADRYLKPQSMSLADAIEHAPIESRWYGEALLAYQAVPLMPCQALFKVYHYAWQLDQERCAGINTEHLARFYCGVIYQSAWERNLDWPVEGGNWLSRMGRRVRRHLGKI